MLDLRPLQSSSAHDHSTGELVAIKKIENILEHKTVTKRTLREIVLLRLFREHENIVKLHRVMRPRFRDFNHLYLVTGMSLSFRFSFIIRCISASSALPASLL
jgi:serine/threonine protein kinase